MKTTWQIWGVPVLMAIFTAFGLLAALLGVGIWHWVSWIALAIPVYLGFRYWLKK